MFQLIVRLVNRAPTDKFVGRCRWPASAGGITEVGEFGQVPLLPRVADNGPAACVVRGGGTDPR